MFLFLLGILIGAFLPLLNVVTKHLAKKLDGALQSQPPNGGATTSNSYLGDLN